MKLSLVFPSWFSEFGAFRHAARKVSTFPPLNLCILGSIAEAAGWQVQLVDAHIERLGHGAIARRVEAFSPDLVGVTATTPFYGDVSTLARLLKSRLAAPVMIGGPHVSILRQEAFAECYDYLFVGECETVFGSFLEAYSAGERFPPLKGIMMRRDGDVLWHGPADQLEDLDRAPLPARHLLPWRKYFLGTPRGRKLYTSVQMSRGCPFSCVFCACDLYGRRVRLRSVGHVADELEELVRGMGIGHVYFVDDTLTIDRPFIMALGDEIERRGLDFTFEGSTRANLWDREMVERLRRCGLVRISFGLETADPRVRKIIRKEVPLECYEAANSLNRELGIETINSVILGLPGDTRESMAATVHYISRSRNLQHVTLNIAMPYPGTEMLRMARERRHGLALVETDYSKYQRYDSAVMKVGEVTPEEMIALQKRALVRIYSRWWRILPAIRRFGVMTFLRTMSSTLASTVRASIGSRRRRNGPRGAA